MFTDRYTSPALRKKRRRRAFRLFFFRILFFVLLFVALVFLARLQGLNIGEITVVGNSIENAEELKKYVAEGMTGAYFLLVPRTNALFYPRRKIEKGIKEKFPRLSAARLSLDGLDGLFLEVKERAPNFIWCPDAENRDCYFADGDGIVFARAPDFSDNMYIKILGGMEGAPLGRKIPLLYSFDEFEAFLNFLKEDGLSPLSAEFGEQGDLSVHLNGGRKILLNQKDKLQDVLTNLESVLDSEIFRKSDLRFEYIDLRFNGKVFYKFSR